MGWVLRGDGKILLHRWAPKYRGAESSSETMIMNKFVKKPLFERALIEGLNYLVHQRIMFARLERQRSYSQMAKEL